MPSAVCSVNNVDDQVDVLTQSETQSVAVPVNPHLACK